MSFPIIKKGARKNINLIRQILFLKLGGGIMSGLGVQDQIPRANFPLGIRGAEEDRDRGKYRAKKLAARLGSRIPGPLRVAIPGQQLIAVHTGVDILRRNGLVGEQGGDAKDFNFPHALHKIIVIHKITSS